MVGWGAPTRQVRNDWLALLLEPPEKVCTPTTEQWRAASAHTPHSARRRANTSWRARPAPTEHGHHGAGPRR